MKHVKRDVLDLITDKVLAFRPRKKKKARGKSAIRRQEFAGNNKIVGKIAAKNQSKTGK